MSEQIPFDVSRRERQIMEVIYARGEASVAEVQEAMPDPPTYSAVRAMLNMLEEKGHLRHKTIGRKFIYLPVITRAKAQRSALRSLLKTFFEGSISDAVASLLELDRERISRAELERLSKMIEQAKKEDH